MKRTHDCAKDFEKALAGESKVHYEMRLFVAGSSPRSARAIRNILAICEEYLSGRYNLEVIDILQHPELVKAAQIVVIPSLLKTYPVPERRMIGDLSDTAQVLAGLDIVRRQSVSLPSKKANAT